MVPALGHKNLELSLEVSKNHSALSGRTERVACVCVCVCVCAYTYVLMRTSSVGFMLKRILISKWYILG